MKVSQDKYEKSKPKAKPAPPPPLQSPDVNVTNNIDMDKVVASVDKLAGVVKDNKPTDNTENLIFAIKGIQQNGDERYTELVRYLGTKIDVLVSTLKDRPTSFEFDIKRNQNGFINTVLVKPTK